VGGAGQELSANGSVRSSRPRSRRAANRAHADLAVGRWARQRLAHITRWRLWRPRGGCGGRPASAPRPRQIERKIILRYGSVLLSGWPGGGASPGSPPIVRILIHQGHDAIGRNSRPPFRQHGGCGPRQQLMGRRNCRLIRSTLALGSPLAFGGGVVPGFDPAPLHRDPGPRPASGGEVGGATATELPRACSKPILRARVADANGTNRHREPRRTGPVRRSARSRQESRPASAPGGLQRSVLPLFFQTRSAPRRLACSPHSARPAAGFASA